MLQVHLECISIRRPAQRDGNGLALDPLLEGGQLGRRPLDGHGGQVRPRLGLSAEGRSSAAAGGNGVADEDRMDVDSGGDPAKAKGTENTLEAVVKYYNSEVRWNYLVSNLPSASRETKAFFHQIL